MNTLVIGDIHGCHDELQALLDAAGLAHDDTIIALGDIVDRGPATPAVVDFFRGHRTARTLMGNHERKHVRGSGGELTLSLSQEIARHQIGPERYPAVLAWMRTLPYYIELPEAMLVHAMWEPGVELAQQREQVLCGTMGGQKDLERRGALKWYERYDGAKPIIVGHENLGGGVRPYVRADGKVIGLDTTCYAGGALTGILLPAFRFVSVPARANHWLAVKRAWAAESAGAGTLDDHTFADLAALTAPRADGRPARRAAEARQLLERADAAVQQLGTVLRAEHERIVATVRAMAAPGADGRAFAKAYQAAIRTKAAEQLLHVLRKDGRLDADQLRARLEKPKAVFDLLASLEAAESTP